MSRTARRAGTAVALGLLAVGLVAAAPASAAPNWGSPVNLSAPALGAFGPQVGIDSGGEAQALWFGSEGSGEVVQASSRPFGAGWSSPQVLPKEEGGMRPDISAAGAFAIAVWQFDGATESRIESAVHSGGGWSSPVNVTDPGEESEYFPRVAANAKGEAVAVWQHCYTGEIIPCFENKGKYVVKASVRRGGTWTMPVTVSSGTENAVKLQTAIDANGNAVVVWEDSEPVALDIHAAKLPNPGTTWTADMLSEPAREAGEPQVAFDGAGNATAIWHSHTSMSNYRVESSVLPAAMTEWPAPQTVYAPTGSFDAFEPQIAVDSAGGAVAIWRLQGPSGDTVQSSVRSGSTWSAPVNVSAGGQEVREPGLAIDPLGDAVAAWRRSNGSNKIVQGAELAPGGSWTAPEDLSAVGQDAVEPDVAIDGKGNAVVVWRTDGANKVAQASSLFALRLQSLSIPTTGTAGTPVSFSVSPLDIWSGVTTSWNFGDGATGSGTAPSHTYAKAGSYTVTVTGTDALGNAASASGTITVAAASKKGTDGGTASAAKVAKVKGGKALLKLSCNKAGPCSGVVKLLAKVEGKKALIGKKSFSIPAGKSRTIKVALNKKGKDKLRKSSHHRFTATLTGSGVKHRTVVLEGS